MGLPNGVALDSAGNVFVADGTYYRIRAVCLDVASGGYCQGKTAGNVYRMVGTGATLEDQSNVLYTSTRINQPNISSLVVNASGTLIFSDAYQVVRSVNP
jgi:hypothetical protein